MIIWTKEPLNCILKNTITLDDEDGYVYVSVHTFEQAIRLSERFNGDFSRVRTELNNDKNNKAENDPIYYKIFCDIAERVPTELRLLVPFTKLTFGLGLKWDEDNLKEQVYGVLHQMSMMIDFNLMLAQPKEVRNKVIFQRSILESYKDSWNMLLQDLKDYIITPVVTQQQIVQPVQVQQPVVQQPIVQQPVVQQPVAQANPVTAANTDSSNDAEEDEENNPVALKLKALAEQVKKRREEEKKRDAEKKAEIERQATNNASGVKKEQVLNNIKNDAEEAANVLAEFDV